jgi:DNA-directed RNA polymerase specialized sigma24 family protein
MVPDRYGAEIRLHLARNGMIMARVYEWPARIASSIAALPKHANGLPAHDQHFWALVEETGDGALPLEVLAYLARTAYVHVQRQAAERVFAAIWQRSSHTIALYALRKHGHYVSGPVSAEDIVVEVFSRLGARLRNATGITFYEVAFLGGARILVSDQGRELDKTFVSSLDMPRVDGDDEEQHEIRDDDAIDPQGQVDVDESRDELQGLVHDRLTALPPRVRQTALLLTQWQTETAIAAELGVSTRMVRMYKAQLRAALDGLQ